MRCDGSLFSKEECSKPATWAVCCSNEKCVVQNFVCADHEAEARVIVQQLVADNGVCPFCDLVYESLEHAVSKWYPLVK